MKPNKKYPYKKVYKAVDATHQQVVAHCKHHRKLVYVWVDETLLEAIRKETVVCSVCSPEESVKYEAMISASIKK